MSMGDVLGGNISTDPRDKEQYEQDSSTTTACQLRDQTVSSSKQNP